MKRALLAAIVIPFCFVSSSGVEGQEVKTLESLLPTDYVATRAKADEARLAKRYADAESLYRALLRTYSSDPAIWEQFAATESALGKRQEALVAWTGAWKSGASPRGEVAYTIARYHAQMGDATSAMDWIDSALVHRLERRPRIQRDTAFVAFRDVPRFRQQAGLIAPDIGRVAGWRFDINYFVEEAQRLSINPARPAFSRAFVDSARALSAAVPHLSDVQVGVGLVRLAGSLGDGHSYLTMVTPTVPVQFYRFSDGLYVVKGTKSGSDLVGSFVERIGDVDADSAMHVIARIASKDNEMTPLWLGVGVLRSPAVMHALGLSSDSARLFLRVRDRNGTSREVSLAPEPSSFVRFLEAPTDFSGEVPLWLQHPRTKHWLTPLPDIRAVYAQYNSVGNDSLESVAQFASKVTAMLASMNASNLIVDVRHNNGGRRMLNTPLLLAMAAFKRGAPGREVFVIMGRGTFSAAQVFISQAEWMVAPVFVGEPSSSRPNFVGEESGVVLPYSHMEGSASSQYHQGSTFQDERPFIAPQMPVTLSAKHYFANRDPVMEALHALLTKRF
jgi:hypothetical protein